MVLHNHFFLNPIKIKFYPFKIELILNKLMKTKCLHMDIY
jgi:hypothetical protein